MPKSRVSAALYLLLVFASGILVGAAVHRLYTTTTASANAPRTPEEWRKRYLDQMRKRVGVSEEQITKVTAIMDDTKARFDQVHAQEKKVHDGLYQQQVDAMKALFDDKQKAAFDAWRAERQRERDLAQQKKK